MPRLILKSPYLKPGRKKSPGGYLKYIATREGVVMAEDTSLHLPATTEQQKQIEKLLKKYPDSKDSHEYQDYAENPTRGNADMFIGSILELYGDAPRRNIYLKYISERPGVERTGANGLFTDEGVPIVLSQVQEEMNNHPGNIWTHIISLRREDAERLGYNTPDAWMHLLRSQRNMIAQQMKIAPENFRWYAAFHNAGHHPHVHMMAYSSDPNEPYLTEKGIENIKSGLAKEIFRQDLLQIYQKQTDFRDKLRHESKEQMERIVAEINAGDFSDPVLEQMLLQLSKMLFQSKGRKQYGYLKPEVKKLVDEIVAHLSGEQHIRELYGHWYDLKEDVLRTYTDTFPERIPLEQNKEFKSIRNAVVQHALQIQLPPEDAHRFDPPLSEPVQPLVDFPDDGSKVYNKAVKFLRDPAMPPTPQLERFYHEAAIRGSVDAVYGIGKIYMKRDIQKAIGFFELAAAQDNTYAEYQLGKIHCFGLGVPRDLDKGMEWLRVSAEHGNQHAVSLLRHVQEHIHTATVRGIFGLLQSIARMIQEDGEHLYQKRTSIDRKQRQKIVEKKLAQGKRTSQNTKIIKASVCSKHYRQTIPYLIVWQHLAKHRKQVKYLPTSLVGFVNGYYQLSVVMCALRKEVITMAKRRANGEGNIRKRKDGRWEGRYTAGTDPETGKQIFKNVLGKTQAEVKEKLKKALEQNQKIDFMRTGKYTVAQWMDEWFENVCKIKVRPSSHQTYRGYIDHHIAPNIGKVPLEKLSTMDLQKLYRKLMNKGRVERIEAENQPKGLSAKTVRNINQVISSAMDFAVAQKIISENPCKAVALPKLEHKEMQTIPAEQLQAFLQEAKATGVYEMYYIELATGLRRGELLGLKWTDIDWKNGIIKVRRQVARIDGEIVEAPLKTKNSYRAVTISQQAIEVLKQQKTKTKELKDPYIFPSPNGGPISPDSVNNMLKRVLERAGIPKVRFHDLRHTFATIALQNGVDIKTVSGMLGHFSAGFTLDTYAHVTTSAQKEAAQTMGNILSL